MSDAAETNGMSQTATAEKARPRRVCEYIKMAGVRCSGGAKLGRPYCFKHDQFARSRGAVNVALLEDEASIALAVSHTVRALADNEIPVANANAMLRGCHVATRLLEYRLRKEMFLAQQRREAAAAAAAAVPVQVVAVEAVPVEAVPMEADPVEAVPAAADEAVTDEAATDEAAELAALRAMTPRERDAAEVARTPLEEAPLGGEEGVARVGSMDGAVYEPAEGEDAVPQGGRPAEDWYEKWKPRFHGLKETWEKGLVRPRVALLDSKMGKLKDMPKYRYPAPEPGPRMPAEARPGPVGEECERGMAAARLQPVDAERSEAAGPEGGELAVVQACAAGGVWVERAESEGVPPGRVLMGTCPAIATEAGVHERFGGSATVRDPECDRSLEVGRVAGTDSVHVRLGLLLLPKMV